MRVFILAGEPSGDFLGACLASAMRTLVPDVVITGVGGVRMREAGVALVKESDHWGAIGIPEALRKAPALFAHGSQLAALLRAEPPDVLVLIDFGAFNVRFLNMLHAHGWPAGMRAVYFVPPGCWARNRAAGRLPFLVDAIATPFPWSAVTLRTADAPARIVWVGHPVLDACGVRRDRAAMRGELGVTPDAPVLLLVPGSRRAELRYLLPTFLQTVRRLTPRPTCLITVAPSLGEARLRRVLPDDLTIRLLHGIDYDYAQVADAALVTSGTATLEVACLGVPMVVAYKGSWGVNLQVRVLQALKRAPKYFSLPNIIADAPVVPEFFQKAATPTALAAALAPLLIDTPARRAQCDAFTAIRHSLGDGQAILRTAALVCEVAGVSPALPIPAALPE